MPADNDQRELNYRHVAKFILLGAVAAVIFAMAANNDGPFAKVAKDLDPVWTLQQDSGYNKNVRSR